jgi:membrane fusion protein (multidrug efflux system)
MGAVAERSEGAARFNVVPDTPANSNPSSGDNAEARRTAPAADAAVAKPAKSGLVSRKLLIGVAAAALLAAAGWYGEHWWTVGRFMVSTDDAYVRAQNTTLAAKTAGYVSSILVADNAAVEAGQVIARIDDGDFRLARDAASEKVLSQEATIARIGRQIDSAQASVAQSRAQLLSAQAGATKAQSELQRQQALAAKDYASKQALETAQANSEQTAAGVASAQAGVDAALANVDVLKAQQQEAVRQRDELRTALAKAERDLSFTEIRAPVTGVIGNRAMQVGDYVQVGQRLASLVPLDEVYVVANFKETQVGRLQPGQKVQVSVDALPEHEIEGTVESFSPASGAIFSLLPPDNATGNFTKIVQRLPIRIHVPEDVAAQRALRPGMSVVVKVDTRPGTTAAASPATVKTAAANKNVTVK